MGHGKNRQGYRSESGSNFLCDSKAAALHRLCRLVSVKRLFSRFFLSLSATAYVTVLLSLRFTMREAAPEDQPYPTHAPKVPRKHQTQQMVRPYANLTDTGLQEQRM